jgi:hypothetical protein
MIIPCYWLAFILQCIAFGILLTRRLETRLPCFTVFLFCMATSHLQVGLHIGSMAYLRAQEAWAPWMAALMLLAGLEAFLWLILSLPRYRWRGLCLLVVCVGMAVLCERALAPERSTYEAAIQALVTMESTVGVLTGMTLALALVWFHGIPIAESAKWHSGSIATLALLNAFGWWLFLWQAVFAAVVLALTCWMIGVTSGPTWRRTGSIPEDRGEQDELWRKAS